MILCIVWLILLLLFHQQKASSLSTNATGNNDFDMTCIPCHIVRLDVLLEVVDQSLPVLQTPIICITKHPQRSYRESYDIDLPESFLQQHHHVIDGGDAFVCVNDAYIDESTNRIVITAMEDNDDESEHTGDIYTVSSYKETLYQQQRRSLQEQQKQKHHKELRLLVVRIIDVNGIGPIESVDSIEATIFGTGSNPQNIATLASVVQQLSAITHDQVVLVPSNNVTTISSTGVIEIPITLPVNGSGFFRELQSEILNATELMVGPMDEAADVYIFCLPDGATLVGNKGWAGFTINFEPVR